MNRAALFLILIGFGTLWGLTIPLTKVAVSSGHHPFGLIFWQFMLSAVVLFVLIKIRGSEVVVDRSHIVFFAVVAFTGTLLPNTASYFAAFHLPAGVMALVIALVPMCSLLVALTLRLERFQFRRLTGVILGGTAIALLVLPDTSLPDPSKAIFVLVALIAPMFYGVEGNYLAIKQPDDTGPVATLFGASVIGAIVSLPLTLISGTFINPFESGIGASELALMTTIGLHIIAYVGYIWMVDQAGPVFSAQIAYIVTPAGIILSIILLGEQPSAFIWIALLILLVGLFLVQPRQKNRA